VTHRRGEEKSNKRRVHAEEPEEKVRLEKVWRVSGKVDREGTDAYIQNLGGEKAARRKTGQGS